MLSVKALIHAVQAFVAHHWNWRWGTTTTRSHLGTGASRARREDLAVQIELTTVVARDYPDNAPRVDGATDSKAQDVEVGQDSASFGSIGIGGEDAPDPLPPNEKAERGALTNLDVGIDRDESAVDPSRFVAYEASPPTPLAQRMRRRQEEIAQKQAEEEFMRII